MKPTLLILAAGMGSGYGGLKQMDPVGPSGETIMDYSVYDAAKAGFGKVVFVIRPDFAADFKAKLGSRYANTLPVDYVFQEMGKLPEGFSVPEGREKPWGTGQAILMAKDLIHEPFAAINADDYYGQDAFLKMARFLDAPSPDFSMVGYNLRQTLSDHGSVARGVCELNGEYLKRVTELTKIERAAGGGAMNKGPEGEVKLSGEEPVSMNFWGFRPSLFPALEEAFEIFLRDKGKELKSEFYIPLVVDSLVYAGKAKVKVLKTSATWFGVTYREDKPVVERSIRALVDHGAYPPNLWS